MLGTDQGKVPTHRSETGRRNRDEAVGKRNGKDGALVIRTTGNLRSELAQLIEDVKAGSRSPEDANLIIKAAGRITDSLYSEAKIAQIAMTTGEQSTRLGQLHIGEGS